tara:strand:+ start:318 stop:998 length:681 start_codon:yes stop_codon:yes gene_type:complete
MAQATLDAFITAKPRVTCDFDAAENLNKQTAGCHSEDTPAPKDMPRLRVAGTSTVLRTIEAVRAEHSEAFVFLVTLSWRHNHPCGADMVIVSNEPRGAAFDLRPPPKPKKSEPKELPSTPGIDELNGMINMGEEIAELLLGDERTHVVVMDGYPQGQIYARFVACIAARCLKLRHPTMPSMQSTRSTPTDAICKALLLLFKKCRSVEKMRDATETYYEKELAYKFP